MEKQLQTTCLTIIAPIPNASYFDYNIYIPHNVSTIRCTSVGFHVRANGAAPNAHVVTAYCVRSDLVGNNVDNILGIGSNTTVSFSNTREKEFHMPGTTVNGTYRFWIFDFATMTPNTNNTEAMAYINLEFLE